MLVWRKKIAGCEGAVSADSQVESGMPSALARRDRCRRQRAGPVGLERGQMRGVVDAGGVRETLDGPAEGFACGADPLADVAVHGAERSMWGTEAEPSATASRLGLVADDRWPSQSAGMPRQRLEPLARDQPPCVHQARAYVIEL